MPRGPLRTRRKGGGAQKSAQKSVEKNTDLFKYFFDVLTMTRFFSYNTRHVARMIRFCTLLFPSFTATSPPFTAIHTCQPLIGQNRSHVSARDWSTNPTQIGSLSEPSKLLLRDLGTFSLIFDRSQHPPPYAVF